MNYLTQPVILGGSAAEHSAIPFVRPQLPVFEDIENPYREILQNGMVTTGSNAEKLGSEVSSFLNSEYAIAISSCTCGLLLTIQALDLPKGSEVILPSFTFMASALGPVWNGLRLKFVDVDRSTMNIDPERVEEAISQDTSAIIAVHQFGNPAPIEEMQALADKHGLALIFDSAHGFGSLHNGQPLGVYGKAEIFSMSPTKLMIAAEGGIVSTNDPDIAEHVRLGRNYGNPGNYDCLFPGLNARMSELHAILALNSLDLLESAALHRNQVVGKYVERLESVPGISFQKISPNDQSSYKDLSIVVDEELYGLTQRQLEKSLLAEGIHTRVYYSPVVHKMKAFSQFADENIEEQLPNTLYLEFHSLSLPIYSDMQDDEIDIVCESIKRIHSHAAKIADAL